MALPNANKSIHGIDEVGTKFVSVGEDDQGKAMTNFKNYLHLHVKSNISNS